MNLTGKIALTLSLGLMAQMSSAQDRPNLLERKLSLSVHRLETLESVLNRLEVDLGTRIDFRSSQLLRYPATSKVYSSASVKTILDEQLSGKPLSYRLHGNKLHIVSRESAK